MGPRVVRLGTTGKCRSDKSAAEKKSRLQTKLEPVESLQESFLAFFRSSDGLGGDLVAGRGHAADDRQLQVGQKLLERLLLSFEASGQVFAG